MRQRDSGPPLGDCFSNARKRVQPDTALQLLDRQQLVSLVASVRHPKGACSLKVRDKQGLDENIGQHDPRGPCPQVDVGGSRVVDLDVFWIFRGCVVRLDNRMIL